MKETEKKRFIVPYAPNIDGNMIGDLRNNYTGMPLFLTEEPEEDADEL